MINYDPQINTMILPSRGLWEHPRPGTSSTEEYQIIEPTGKKRGLIFSEIQYGDYFV